MTDTVSELRFLRTLTDAQLRLWKLLRGGAARDIAVLAKAIDPNMAEGWPRYQQQRVSAHVSRINAKLPEGWRIGPGEPRHTYQLMRSRI